MTPTIQQEIQQRLPFRSQAQEALLALLRTTDVVKYNLDQVAEKYGVTSQQYNVLRILRGAGSPGLPTLAIGERMIERAPGITRLIDRLEARGLVARMRGEDDRRQVVCRITPAGLKLLKQMDRPVDEADERALGGLTDTELTRLIRILAKVRELNRAP